MLLIKCVFKLLTPSGLKGYIIATEYLGCRSIDAGVKLDVKFDRRHRLKNPKFQHRKQILILNVHIVKENWFMNRNTNNTLVITN